MIREFVYLFLFNKNRYFCKLLIYSIFCNFDMINEETLRGECELPLKNHSENDVQFSIEFYESSPSKYGPKVSLMNKNGPYKVRLKGKESKVVQIEADIDVSKIKKHSDGGAMTGSVPIIIRSGEKSRKL